MSRHSLLFDLDGTLSDPLEGFIRSINYALEAYGYPSQQESILSQFVGPPLESALQTLSGTDDDRTVSELVKKYRERYGAIGYAENTLYPGIREALEHLTAHDVAMAVCTTKRQDFAEQILQRFNLRSYFRFVSGGDVGIPKWQQIKQLLSDKAIDHSTIMIGDRASDLTAAHQNGLVSAGVLWGYGSRDELEAAAPRYLLAHPAELPSFLGESYR
jgi:phosphoglycolate phosphatase